MQCNSCRPRRWSRLRSCCLHLQRLPMRCCCGSSIGFIGESRRPRARLRRQLRNDQGLAAQREPGERFGLLESFWRFKFPAPLESGLAFEFVVPAGLLPVPVVFPGLLVAAPELAEPPEAAPLVPAALPPASTASRSSTATSAAALGEHGRTQHQGREEREWKESSAGHSDLLFPNRISPQRRRSGKLFRTHPRNSIVAVTLAGRALPALGDSRIGDAPRPTGQGGCPNQCSCVESDSAEGGNRPLVGRHDVREAVRL